MHEATLFGDLGFGAGDRPTDERIGMQVIGMRKVHEVVDEQLVVPRAIDIAGS